MPIPSSRVANRSKSQKGGELDQMKDGSAIQNTLVEITGQRTVPNVWVKGKFIGGNDDIHALLRSGKLKEMLS